MYVGSLNVFVSHEQNQWFAQGIEIDYAACGDSLEDVQTWFEAGLKKTIHAHLARFESIDRLLKSAPESEYQELTEAEPFTFWLVTFHRASDWKEEIPFPFSGITYLGRNLAA